MEINVEVTKNNFYNIYNKDELSPDFSHYLYEKIETIKLKEKVIINIKCLDKITNEEKHQMVDIIRKNYGLKIKKGLFVNEYEITRFSLLFFIGVVFLVLSLLMRIDLLAEIFLIIGWIGIWESISSFIFDIVKRNIGIKRLKQLVNAKINIE